MDEHITRNEVLQLLNLNATYLRIEEKLGKTEQWFFQQKGGKLSKIEEKLTSLEV